MNANERYPGFKPNSDSYNGNHLHGVKTALNPKLVSPASSVNDEAERLLLSGVVRNLLSHSLCLTTSLSYSDPEPKGDLISKMNNVES